MHVADIRPDQLPLLARLYEELTGLASDLDRMAAVLAAMAADPNWHLLGATAPDGVLAGALLGCICQDMVGACRPFLVVENVIVSGAYRRRGVGRCLLAAMEARARDCFYALQVSGRDRAGAQAFYRSLGYDEAAGFKKRL